VNYQVVALHQQPQLGQEVQLRQPVLPMQHPHQRQQISAVQLHHLLHLWSQTNYEKPTPSLRGLKRRQLPFASIEGLRPTPDRVRETLFNWLMWDVQNSNVLDICAGFKVAFEALSRGASKVVMIEPDRSQAQFLTQT
jgi:hypothetical protein